MTNYLLTYKNLSEELDSLLTSPIVYRLMEDEKRPQMLNVKGEFILLDSELSKTLEEVWRDHIVPILQAIAQVCNGCKYLLCCEPGLTSSSKQGDKVGYQQVLYVDGLMPVLLRVEYEPKSAGTLVSISVLIRTD